jgi:hypothetical protein
MITEQTREKLMKHHRGQCVVCGSDAHIVVDHVQSRADGGGDEEWNLQLLCRSCNSSKGDDDMHGWLASGRWKDAKDRNKSRRGPLPKDTFAALAIAEFGGLRSTGIALGIGTTTVQTWRQHGVIPVEYWREISVLLPQWTIERIAHQAVHDMERLIRLGIRKRAAKRIPSE